jgi:hypothetical protein
VWCGGHIPDVTIYRSMHMLQTTCTEIAAVSDLSSVCCQRRGSGGRLQNQTLQTDQTGHLALSRHACVRRILTLDRNTARAEAESKTHLNPPSIPGFWIQIRRSLLCSRVWVSWTRLLSERESVQERWRKASAQQQPTLRASEQGT